MTTAKETTDLVRAVKENSGRLGLTWTRRYGTVQAMSGLVAIVVLDGESLDDEHPAGGPVGAHVRCNSLIGQLPSGTRVAVDSVPPDAHYVVGVLAVNPATLVANAANGAPPLLGVAGATNAGPTAATSFTQAVSFPFTLPSVPFMPSPNINSGAGSTSGWNVRAISITTTGFTLFGFGTSSTFNVSINWVALINS